MSVCPLCNLQYDKFHFCVARGTEIYNIEIKNDTPNTMSINTSDLDFIHSVREHMTRQIDENRNLSKRIDNLEEFILKELTILNKR